MKYLLLFIFSCVFFATTYSQENDSTYQDVEEVFISSKKKKNIVFEDPKYYIVDFTVSNENAFLLMKNLGKYYLYELDENMQFASKLRLNMNANSLFQDCFGNTHLIASDSAYFILDDEYGLFLTEAHPRKEFMKAMEKCVGTVDDKIILENHARFEQNQTFYTIDRASGEKNIIYRINDSTYISNVLNEQSESQQGVSEVRLSKRYLLGNIERPQRYNPLFVVDDSLYIFNHFEGRMDQLDMDGNVQKSLKINHHKKKGWDRRIYSDISKRQFYAVWVKNGAQHLIGLAMNKDEQNFGSKITKHAYPEKVIVRDGYAYYTYKPNFDANLNKLYRQKL